MIQFNYNSAKGFNTLQSMLITIAAIWLLVGIFVKISPAIKWHSIIVGGVATIYILILYAGRLPKQRKFRIRGPLFLDKKGMNFHADIKGEQVPITLMYSQITAAKYYRDMYVVETAGAKYRFHRVCFDSADSFRHFREKLRTEYDKANGK